MELFIGKDSREVTPPMWRNFSSLGSTSPAATGQNLISYISYHAHTILLFAWSDYKTIFIPIVCLSPFVHSDTEDIERMQTAFACSAAPLHSLNLPNLLRACFWLWTHQLMCNVSSQSQSKHEDTINRPWRPVPSGRVSTADAVVLRWTLVLLCLSWSVVLHHSALALSTLSLVTAAFLYEELGWARNPIGKNVCNAVGYMSLEAGTTMLMGQFHSLDNIPFKAVILSGLVTLTTIHAQDFCDAAGDASTGRTTLPLYAPESSRAFTLLAIGLWSIAICWIWGVPSPVSVIFLGLGWLVGFRYYWYRDVEMDKTSYLLYNFWLAVVHVLPLYARV